MKITEWTKFWSQDLHQLGLVSKPTESHAHMGTRWALPASPYPLRPKPWPSGQAQTYGCAWPGQPHEHRAPNNRALLKTPGEEIKANWRLPVTVIKKLNF